MKANGTQRFYARLVSLLLAAAVTLLGFGVCPALADGETQQKQITPTLYQTDDTGIVDGWEGNTVQADLITTSSSGSDVHNSMPIKYDEQQKRTVTWGSWGYMKNSYNAEQQTEHVAIQKNSASNARDLIVYFTPQLKKDGNTKLVIGARASRDSTFYVHFVVMGANGQAGDWKDFGTKLTVSGGDTFREYTIIDSSNANWNNLANLKNLRIGLESPAPTVASSLDVAYIRVVDETYGVNSQNPIASGAVAYDVADNIVDFEFGEALDASSVHSSGITLNGAPVRWAMTLPENPSRIRVSLGELRKSRAYTVSFSGLTTADGYAVTNADFTFTTTMLEAVDSNITMHRAAKPAGIVKSWEGTDIASSTVSSEGNGSDTNTMKEGSDSHTVKWEDWGNASETWMPEVDAERVVVWPNTTPSILSYYTDKWEKGNATKLAVGIRSSANFSVRLYAGASGNSLYSSEACNFTTKGNNVFQEYVFKKSDFKNSTWDAQTQFGYLRLDVTNTENTAQYMEIAYVRLVDDSYNGPFGEVGADITPEEFGDTFDTENDYVFDLVFDKDIDLRDVSNDTFKFNRRAANYVMINPANPKRIRVSMKTPMTPLTRAKFKVSGLYTADGAPVNEKVFRFTTAAADVQTGEQPVLSTFDLVTDYKSPTEAAVTPGTDLSGKTITAAAGGLYNNTEESKSYMLTLACYDENGALADIATQTYTLCSYESLSETGTSSNSESGTGTGATKVALTVPSEGRHTVKAFAWDMGTMSPLRSAVSPVDGQEPIKLLIMGNSITYHGAAPSIGWTGNWGMAATSAEQDYSHLLAAKARTLVPVSLRIHGIGDFERYFYDFSKIEGSAHKEEIRFEPDIIVCTIGANIKQTHLEDEDGNQTDEVFNKEHYKNIIDYFNPNGKAKVIVGNTIFTTEDAKAQIKAYADENGVPYVEMGDLTAEEYLGKPYKDAPCFTEKVTNGVLIHPGNKGMAVMADRLWVPLKAAIEECLANR